MIRAGGKNNSMLLITTGTSLYRVGGHKKQITR